MSELELAFQINVTELKEGDHIKWTEEWTAGTKEFAATVLSAETEHCSAELTRPERTKTSLLLDVTKGDADDVDCITASEYDGNRVQVTIEEEV